VNFKTRSEAGGLKILSTQLDETGALDLVVRASMGATYTVEYSTNLVQWSPWLSFLGQSTNQAVRVPLNAVVPAAFYRLSR